MCVCAGVCVCVCVYVCARADHSRLSYVESEYELKVRSIMIDRNGENVQEEDTKGQFW